MTDEQLEANRKCPYGGGCKDCPCDGICCYAHGDNKHGGLIMRPRLEPTMTQRIIFAERSERSTRGGD